MLICLAWQKARHRLGRAFKSPDSNNLNPDLPLISSPFVLSTLDLMGKGRRTKLAWESARFLNAIILPALDSVLRDVRLIPPRQHYDSTPYHVETLPPGRSCAHCQRVLSSAPVVFPTSPELESLCHFPSESLNLEKSTWGWWDFARRGLRWHTLMSVADG